VNDQVATVFTTFLYILIVLIVIRSLLTWFPIDRRNQVVQLLDRLTEPLLEPARRMIPRTGMIDLSAMAVIFLLYAMIYVVNQAAER